MAKKGINKEFKNSHYFLTGSNYYLRQKQLKSAHPPEQIRVSKNSEQNSKHGNDRGTLERNKNRHKDQQRINKKSLQQYFMLRNPINLNAKIAKGTKEL